MTEILRETTFHICVSMEVQEQSIAGLMRLKTPTMENAKTSILKLLSTTMLLIVLINIAK